MKLRVTAQAAQDLRDIEERIAKDNPAAALRFVDRLTERCHALLDSPGIGRKRDELLRGLRSTTVGRYLIFYRQETEYIVIIHVLHGHRDFPALFQHGE